MAEDGVIQRGFHGRRPPAETAGRIPPGQYLERDFPVLTAGPTPRVLLEQWDFRVLGLDGAERGRWSWDEFAALPHEEVVCDIHCVTRWSKLDTRWRGVSLDRLLGDVPAEARYAVAFCDGGYTTNLPLDALRGGRAWVVDSYEGAPLPAEHGGPARLLVPALYLWKSAKWVRGLRLLAEDRPGFWETRGYHNVGDPWKEQRYWDD
jgi:DMSO/TMAO reductase YedYZ molybdopterin-dependent catalytic subunit